MRKRILAVLSILFGITVALFFLFPLVYSPMFTYGGPIIPASGTPVCGGGCPITEYKSISCEVFSVGISYGHWIGNGFDTTQWSLQFGCPPKAFLLS